ncbi:hypothetical protein BO71DRAFT_75598 [Aspergillus ellipticus CBS 707.79]|uniref:Uncharacterized protein n=1 Tax=Aspergillus ellipticus CBS 707.79 TaxID=1448320 RepID=A0A319EHK8_9EURO|nr:hypothetical protein BO71DRAFT_75598 [Aspergillus ellipticus CBS 707.79]
MEFRSNPIGWITVALVIVSLTVLLIFFKLSWLLRVALRIRMTVNLLNVPPAAKDGLIVSSLGLTAQPDSSR